MIWHPGFFTDCVPVMKTFTVSFHIPNDRQSAFNDMQETVNENGINVIATYPNLLQFHLHSKL